MNRKTAIPFAMQIPVISTAHMPKATALDKLVREGGDIYIIADYGHGAFVWMPEVQICATWLQPIARWAKAHVFEWIRFDADGDVVDGLPVYDWDAGDGRSLFDTESNE